MEALLLLLEVVTSTPTALLISLAAVLLMLLYWPIWNRHKYPPGPWPLPFLGNDLINLIYPNPMKYYSEAGFPEVFTIYSGTTPIAVLNSSEAVIEGFVKNADKLSERPKGNGVVSQVTGAPGLINQYETWKELRRHTMAVFRGQGGGNAEMEKIIAEESNYYISALYDQINKPFNIKNQLMQSISNVITKIVFGKRMEYSSDQLANLQFDDFIYANRTVGFLPFLKYIPGDPLKYRLKRKQFEAGVQFVRDEIDSHKKDLDPNHPRDYVDSYLVEMDKAPPGSPFTEGNLLTSAMQLYLAGTDTTSSALHWAFLYMILYPDVQRKVQMEIFECIGDRVPQYADRHRMHYTHAVVTEVLRLGITTGGGLPHYATEDVVVRGYRIRTGMIVQANLWFTMNDKRFFKDPRLFDPKRFLDDEGKFAKPAKTFVPFSTGRRVCLAEAMARMELFIFLVQTLQKFNIAAPEGEKLQHEGRVHFVYSPYPYKLILTQRS